MDINLHYLLLPYHPIKSVEKMPKVVKQHPTKKNYFAVEQQVNVWAEVEKTKPSISEIVKFNLPISVLGAGPNLPEDLKKIPKGLTISCNHHALKLVKTDFMCFLDPIEQQKGSDFYHTVLNSPCTRISLTDLIHTDIYCVNEYPEELSNPSDTGRFALWVASQITTGDIYLAGMNLRVNGEPNHFYDDKPLSTWGGPDLNRKINQWMKFINYVGKDRVKVLSGPLKDI